MVSTPFSLTEAWSETNSYTAAETCAALLSNTSASDIRWARGPDSAAPGVEPSRAHLLRPGRSQSVPLELGETLWMAGSPQGYSVVDVFATTEVMAVEGGQAPLASRAELVPMTAYETRPDGEEIRADGLSYVWTTGAVAIPDLPGLLPLQTVTLEHFGAVGDGVTDDTPAWDAAMDYLESIGGGVIEGGLQKTYGLTNTTIASKVTFRGHGQGRGGLKALASSDGTEGWLTNRDVSSNGNRTCLRPQILDCDLDGTDLPFKRWLSRADGTPVTDPETDYVMGSGLLASGISGVSLTAVVSDGTVTGVTVNNGGSGWNGHPTHPYQDSTVMLRFDGGGGTGAKGYATISGGTLTSVTLSRGGTGYASAPVVSTMGGYADISLLAEPSVDRRNPEYAEVGSGVFFNRTIGARVENVRFIGFRRMTLGEGGGLNTVFRNLEFIDCGKDDGAMHCIWTQAIGNPANPTAAFCDTQNILIEDVYIDGAERSAVAFMPTKGGTIRRLYAKNCGEATIFINSRANYNGGKILIEDCDLLDGYMTDLVSHMIEINGAPDITIRGNRIRGGVETAINCPGCRNLRVIDNTFIDNITNATKTGDGRKPFGPFTERFAFNQGERPECAEELSIEAGGLFWVGTMGGVGCDNVVFRGNRFEESRAVHPGYIFVQVKSAGDNLAGDLTVIDNDFSTLPADIALWKAETPNVFKSTMPLRIANNRGHASDAPVIETASLTATGAFSVTPGFRPNHVRVYAHTNNVNDLHAALGEFSWTRDGGRNDFTWTLSSDGTGNFETRFFGTDVIRITDQFANQICRVEFNNWKEDGFVLNAVLLTEDCTLKMVCIP